MRALVLLLTFSISVLAGDPPKSKLKPPAKKPIRKPQLPPAWIAKPIDPKSPAKPFARGIYTTEADWLPLFKPSGKLTTEVKMKTGHTLRVYAGSNETNPRTPASLELVKGDTPLFCARGYRFFNPVAEDITGDKVPDLIRVTHASGLQPTTYHQFLFTFVGKFRVQTIGPFVNEKNTQPK